MATAKNNISEEIKNNTANNIVYFVFASIFLMLTSSIYHGSFTNPFQLFFVLFALFALALPLLNIRFLDKIYSIASVKNLLLASTTISIILFYFFDNGIFLVSGEAVEKINALKFIAIFIFLFYFIRTSGKIGFLNDLVENILKYKFAILIMLAVIMRIATIMFSPHPYIDVFYITNDGVENLVRGIDPYSASYTSPLPGFYSNPGYLPAVIFMNLPGRIIFQDVRFGYIIAQLIIIAIIYLLLREKYAENKIMIELPILMFMYYPNSLFVLEQTWIEPLLLLILFLFALIFIKQKLSYLACAILGLFISLKQNNFPFLIFALASFRIDLKKISLILSAIFLPIIPFLIWNYRSFIGTAILYPLNFKVMSHSVSLDNMYALIFSKEIPHYVSFGIILTAIIFLSLQIKKTIYSIICSHRWL